MQFTYLGLFITLKYWLWNEQVKARNPRLEYYLICAGNKKTSLFNSPGLVSFIQEIVRNHFLGSFIPLIFLFFISSWILTTLSKSERCLGKDQFWCSILKGARTEEYEYDKTYCEVHWPADLCSQYCPGLPGWPCSKLYGNTFLCSMQCKPPVGLVLLS